MNLDNNELQQVARHFGHSIEVHHSYYRAHHELVEKSTIAKLLMASEDTSLHKYVSIILLFHYLYTIFSGFSLAREDSG